MKKKGFSQIDWVVSLALFLLYVGWFFAFLMPTINYSRDKSTLIDTLKVKFENEFSAEVEIFPIFLKTNRTGYNPVFMDYSADTEITFRGDIPYNYWNNKIIFLANASAGDNTYTVVKAAGNSSYDQYGLNVLSRRVTTLNVSVDFDESMPESLRYIGDERVDNIEYYVKDISYSPESYARYDLGFAAIYTNSIGNINHTTIVFAENPNVYNFITQDSTENITFRIIMELEAELYTNYYSDNNNYADLNYTEEKTETNFSADYVTIYGDDSFSIFLQSDAELNFTYYNDTFHLEIEITAEGNYEYTYKFHSGNYNNAERYDNTVYLGVTEAITAIDLDTITTNYSYLKNRWSFPYDREFSIKISKNTTAQSYGQSALYGIGTFNPGVSNVNAETVDSFAFDDSYNLVPISVNYRIW